MASRTWIISGSAVAVRDDEGHVTFPSARDVFAAVFEANSSSESQQNTAPGPKVDLPHLAFSQFPARPAVKLSGSPPDSLRASLGVTIGESFHEISPGQDQLIVDNCWFPISVEAVTEAQGWLTKLGIQSDRPLSLPELIHIRRAPEAPVNIIDGSSAAAASVASVQPFPADSLHGLNADLFPYQKDGIAFLNMISGQAAGCVLADEMGLGKTLQVIGLITSEVNQERLNNLVIVPASLVENWRRELETFNPRLHVWIHIGPLRAGVAWRLRDWDVVITSYETAVRDLTLLSDVRWNLLVLDEAQYIKNPDAQRTETIKQIPRRVSIAVTGTPLENRLEDYWSVVDFAVPGMLGELAGFRRDFANDVQHARRLGSIAEPVILRRLVLDVAQDLPDLIEIPQAIEMSPRLAQAYEDTRRSRAADGSNTGAGLATFTELRVLCTHPLLKNPDWGAPDAHMPKYQRLLDILEEIFLSGEKALIFTSFTGMIDLLEADLGIRWPDGFFRSIDGRVAMGKRTLIIDEFADSLRFGALVLNPQAAGVGLNITAANHVIHYNPEWNPARTDQATRRAYRRRQERPVTVHHLFFAESVEDAIVTRSEFKRILAGEAVQGHDGNIDPQFLVDALSMSPFEIYREAGRQ